MKSIIQRGIGSVLILAISISLNAQNFGDPAPDFTYISLTGDTVSLSDLLGNVIFIFVFGNQCPACISVGNDTETKVHQAFNTYENFRAIGVDTWDFSSSVTTVQAFKTVTGITYPLLLQAGSFEDLYNTSYDRIIIVDQNGDIAYKGQSIVAVTLDAAIEVLQNLLSATSISENKLAATSFHLGQNYPNPFNPNTTIPVSLNQNESMTLKIFDLLGNHVETLASDEFASGEYQFTWDATDVVSGLYFYQIKTSTQTATKRMLIQK